MASKAINTAIKVLQSGGIIAYPTEAVFGLGCDPANQAAVERLLQLKKRKASKGLILIAASWDQVKCYTKKVAPETLQEVLKTWPGPFTWVFPSSKKTPKWITGDHDSVAIRVSAHPVVQALCNEFNGAIVSTSANIADHLPAKTIPDLLQQFPCGIDFIVPGNIGKEAKPTQIRDVKTRSLIR
ncbi:MAG: L-threonylcarbamoyladenylate synthase [Gammaproteobacteria bacterium]|nr:L-threonylcarbamoyladenylate synthase [Gammaproteobacteria bacterium]